jgi:uncharacterized protein
VKRDDGRPIEPRRDLHEAKPGADAIVQLEGERVEEDGKTRAPQLATAAGSSAGSCYPATAMPAARSLRFLRSLPLLVALAACGRPVSTPSSPPPGDAGGAGTTASTAAPPGDADTVAQLAQAAIARIGDGLDGPELAETMPRLARAALAALPDTSDEDALRDRALLQVVAGDPAAATLTLDRLRTGAKRYDPAAAAGLYTSYGLAARAKAAQAATRTTFEEAYKKTFRDAFSAMDDAAAEHALWRPDTNLDRAKSEVRASLDNAKKKSVVELADAVDLAARYAAYAIRRDILPLAASLQAEDIARRYVVDDDVRIKTRDGATISALVVRPRRVTAPAPAVLVYTIYTDAGVLEAIEPAAHGYVSVLAFTRGKRKSPDAIVPYEHETGDTYDTIDWISKQSWCDGKVGMYGGSYGGFSQWAATKHLHPALKTIVPYVAAIPGQGLPMENNVFLNVNYGWAFYVANGKYMDDAVYFDRPRWNALPDKWFASGRSYREIDKVDGTPNPLLQRWLAHPAYDAYWQAMVPYREDFSRIDIPILSVTGYYDDGQISALRYFTEHYKFNKNARHYLVIGPYDHFGAQRRPSRVLNGYTIDEVARIDTTYITFQWFDHVLRGGPMPELVKDKVNWEVMGANEWRHAPSIDKMHDQVLTLYLDDHRLVKAKPDGARFLEQKVDLADRKTTYNEYYPSPIVQDALDDGHGIVFTGDPLEQPMSLDGTLSGELRVSINKKDMDVGVVLYEKTPEGKYFNLTYYLGRASYARDLSVRRLLTPGKVEAIDFERTRMVSRQLAKGSRLVVVVNVNKNAFAQVNHGTGKDVSDETIADAKGPLEIRWYGDSYVRLPVRGTSP